MGVNLFLSHSHHDRAIVDALTDLLSDFFGGNVTVSHSSDLSAGGGIPPGAQWLPWITDHIIAADQTYVMLTPNSMSRPWVLWESGAAAGVAMATSRQNPVVPVTFGIADEDVPSPFSGTQAVHVDPSNPEGITRLLQDLNGVLHTPLAPRAFDSTAAACLPGFFAKVTHALERSAPLESLLASVPHSFSVARLGGLWVTSYTFVSSTGPGHHADLAELTAESDRRVRATNASPPPRTEGHRQPFLNEISAELANRHVIGHWKNLSDTRYFGGIHLAVLPGEDVMEGVFSTFDSDVVVGTGRWKWVRIDPATTAGVDRATLALKDPTVVHAMVTQHTKNDGPLALDAVTESRAGT